MMMKTSIERLEDDQLRLDIEVPDAILQEAVDATLVHMSRDMRIPGFRPGKVPPQAVLARVGREAAVAEAIRLFLDDWYRSAVMAAGIRPVDAPEIDFPDEGMPAEGASLRISATVKVTPRPKFPALETIEVDRPNLPDITPYVDQVIEATLRGVGELKDTGAAAVEGDEVVVDFHCTVAGGRVNGAAATGYGARIGDGRLLEVVEATIIGVTA
ncbi:MAG: hypothetical protein H7123_05875, partial [Thermoleophilia bacterium]|nr:hypothetical protein [Thermoleophilia bacterium]